MRKIMLAQLLVTATVVAALTARPLVGAVAAPQNGELGHSYLKLVIDGKTMQNVPWKQEYKGWLTLDGVDARAFPHQARPPTETYHGAGWTSLDKFLRDGPKRSGELDFGVADDGGLDPMLEAVKRKVVIPEADLDYYDYEKNVLVGKYKLVAVQIISVENAAASACAMYDVRVRFKSISPR